MADAEERTENIKNIVAMRTQYRQQAADMKKKSFSRLVTNIVILIIFLTVSGVGMSSVGYMQVFGFMLIGLLPSMVAIITDSRPGRFASKTIIAFNLSGMTPHLASILYSGSPNQTAIAIMAELQTWTLIYGFAAFGWGIVFVIPYITELYLEVKAAYTVKKLNKFREDLIDEWGDEIKK